jgi:uncharacterized protein YkwD
MNASRLPKIAGGGAFLILLFAFLAASPMHTSPRESLLYAAAQAPGATAHSNSTPANGYASSGAPDDSVGTRPASQPERFFFDAVNRERGEQGLPQLSWDQALAVAARKHAALMAEQNELSHRLAGEADLGQRTAQAGARFSVVGENVAIGPDSPGIHSGWMKSPGHRANILGADFNALGVGVAERDGQLYAVEDFSRAVENLNLQQQEQKVGAMLSDRGYHLSQSRDDAAEARAICEAGSPRHSSMDSRHPNMQILQYETADLGTLAEQLDRGLRNNSYRYAAVGACSPANREGSLPHFRVVILLFPSV